MSSRDFINEMIKAGEKYSGVSGQGIISRVKIEFGLHRYVAGHDFWSFWKPCISNKEVDSVGQELQGRLQQAGCTDLPAFGVKVTIDKNVLGRNEPYKADLQEFIPAWQGDSFQMIMDYLDEGNLPMNEFFWGKVQYKANPFFVKQGEAGKKEIDQNGNPRFPSVRVPVEKFASEEAAHAAAVGGGNSGSANVNSQWSQTAIDAYGPNMDTLDQLANEINECLTNATNGIPFNDDPKNFPLPKPPTPPNLKKYVADIYTIESTDLDLLTPF
jgi:uncharacterized protein YukE